MERISVILRKYISSRIPQYATNIFYQLFTGIENTFSALQYRLDITKRERNILTAQHLSSLRNLSAQNGFEPTLKIPASGVLKLQINPKAYNRLGYPLYLPPYSIFTNKVSKLSYYYNSANVLKLTSEVNFINVVEGALKTVNTSAQTGEYIEKIYLSEQNIANNSIIVEVNGVQYLEVKSFQDSLNINDNKQFVVKFSGDIQNPIVLYVQNIEFQDAITITYRLSSGELGNLIEVKTNFETSSILDTQGVEVELGSDEIEITNFSGFTLGSDGTDENALRAAIGYNHGINLLFDDISYRNFLNKYSTILLQTITHENGKPINDIFVSKRCSINILTGNPKTQYTTLRDNKKYIFTSQEKQILSATLSEFEYALSSHNIFDANTNNFAFQLIFPDNITKENHETKISNILYTEFSHFLYNKNYNVNIENLFTNYMQANKITFEYTIFNQNVEEQKIKNNSEIQTPYIIKHDNLLPILHGNFTIIDSDMNKVQLFFDINSVSL